MRYVFLDDLLKAAPPSRDAGVFVRGVRGNRVYMTGPGWIALTGLLPALTHAAGLFMPPSDIPVATRSSERLHRMLSGDPPWRPSVTMRSVGGRGWLAARGRVPRTATIEVRPGTGYQATISPDQARDIMRAWSPENYQRFHPEFSSALQRVDNERGVMLLVADPAWRTHWTTGVKTVARHEGIHAAGHAALGDPLFGLDVSAVEDHPLYEKAAQALGRRGYAPDSVPGELIAHLGGLTHYRAGLSAEESRQLLGHLARVALAQHGPAWHDVERKFAPGALPPREVPDVTKATLLITCQKAAPPPPDAGRWVRRVSGNTMYLSEPAHTIFGIVNELGAPTRASIVSRGAMLMTMDKLNEANRLRRAGVWRPGVLINDSVGPDAAHTLAIMHPGEYYEQRSTKATARQLEELLHNHYDSLSREFSAGARSAIAATRPGSVITVLADPVSHLSNQQIRQAIRHERIHALADQLHGEWGSVLQLPLAESHPLYDRAAAGLARLGYSPILHTEEMLTHLGTGHHAALGLTAPEGIALLAHMARIGNSLYGDRWYNLERGFSPNTRRGLADERQGTAVSTATAEDGPGGAPGRGRGDPYGKAVNRLPEPQGDVSGVRGGWGGGPRRQTRGADAFAAARSRVVKTVLLERCCPRCGGGIVSEDGSYDPMADMAIVDRGDGAYGIAYLPEYERRMAAIARHHNRASRSIDPEELLPQMAVGHFASRAEASNRVRLAHYTAGHSIPTCENCGARFSGMGKYEKAVLLLLKAMSFGDLMNEWRATGVHPDVVSFVSNEAPAEHRGHYVAHVNRNPGISLEELRGLPLPERKQFQPTPYETGLLEGSPPDFQKWAMTKVRGLRKRQLPGGSWTYRNPRDLDDEVDPTARMADGVPANALAGGDLAPPAPVTKRNDFETLWTQLRDWNHAMAQHPELGHDLTSYDLPRAIDASDSYHEEVGGRYRGNQYIRSTPSRTVYAWPDGWRMVDVDHPHDLETESGLMHHCVGDVDQPYRRAVERGETKIYSLRDRSNAPHATVEITPAGRRGAFELPPTKAYDRVIQVKGHGDKEPLDDYQDRLREWFDAYPEPLAWHRNEPLDIERPLYEAEGDPRAIIEDVDMMQTPFDPREVIREHGLDYNEQYGVPYEFDERDIKDPIPIDLIYQHVADKIQGSVPWEYSKDPSLAPHVGEYREWLHYVPSKMDDLADTLASALEYARTDDPYPYRNAPYLDALHQMHLDVRYDADRDPPSARYRAIHEDLLTGLAHAVAVNLHDRLRSQLLSGKPNPQHTLEADIDHLRAMFPGPSGDIWRRGDPVGDEDGETEEPTEKGGTGGRRRGMPGKRAARRSAAASDRRTKKREMQRQMAGLDAEDTALMQLFGTANPFASDTGLGIGVTPPLHPNCRCRIITYSDGSQFWRVAQDDRLCNNCLQASEAFNAHQAILAHDLAEEGTAAPPTAPVPVSDEPVVSTPTNRIPGAGLAALFPQIAARPGRMRRLRPYNPNPETWGKAILLLRFGSPRIRSMSGGIPRETFTMRAQMAA